MTNSRSRWWKRAAAIAAVSSVAAAARGQDAPAEPAAEASADAAIAFVHVAVVPMDREAVLADHTVIVRDGRIAALGPSAETDVPAEARVIDGAGAWLMPGLADMHVHTYSEDDLFLFVANGVTAVRNMFGSPMHLGWRERIERGRLVGPRIHTAGPIVDGNPPVWPGSRVLTDPSTAEAIVREQVEAGYEFLKPYSRLSAEAYDALAAAAKQHGRVLMGHVPRAVDLDHVLAAGQRTIEHLDGYVEAALADDSLLAGKLDSSNEDRAWEEIDVEKLARAAERTRDAGAWNCPTIVVVQRWVQGPDAEAMLARPEMRYVSPFTRASWGPTSSWNYLNRMPAERVAQAKASIPARLRAVLVLHEAGARILAGTDMGNPYVTPGFALHHELANLAAAGLSPYETLRAATAGAAECLGADWGVVAAGRRADLLLVEANPLDDVGNAARRKGVLLAGRWFPEEELRTELEARAARYEAAAKK